jgi:PucR family transcriptional regulator, purine catabolism regulatory protein
MPTLAEALDFPALAAAEPMVRSTGGPGVRRVVRWVHSSEVLEIAPLLRGGEMLLTGGTQLLTLPPTERRSYVAALASRGLAALAVETVGWEDAAVDDLVADAESAGLTLVELRRTVRFVDIAEEINSAIVNREARIRSAVDELSHRIAEHISVHGPDTQEILQLAAHSLRARISLIGTEGDVQEAGGELLPADDPDAHAVQEAGIVVGGHLAARLRVESVATQAELVTAATGRLTEVLALALAQSFRPSMDQIAEARLMRAIIDEAPRDAVERLWRTTALPAGPACVVLGLTLGPASTHEVVLGRVALAAAGVPWGQGRALLVPLGRTDPARRRADVVSALAEAADGMPVRCTVGPLVWDGAEAHASFVGARAVLEEEADDPGVLDVSAHFGRRVLTLLEATPFVSVEIRAALGRVQDWDRRHGTVLVETLARWLDSGCHVTATAGRLHIERQTLHKRLAKAFELLGEDPRERGDVFSLHVAVRVAMLRTDT